VFTIFDYDTDQARKIMKTCGDIRINKHVLDNWFDRGIDFSYIKECIKVKIPLANIKTRENRFKLIYPHQTKTKHDLYIIIEISDNKEVEVITAYPHHESRRLREYESR
jgi:hypothetical protein